ncbi:MAG TPA: TatD family hydrolase [Terriglobia bacterium]|nr:TatD family hydrolase [Terriglobia bacterium]
MNKEQISGLPDLPEKVPTDHPISRCPDLPIYLDSHAHLDDSDYDPDRDAVIERARAAGLRYILVAGGGTGPDRLNSPIPIAESYDWIYASVGLHPHEARHFTDSHAERIAQLARHPKVVAVGEIGLDYYYTHSPREIQQQVLIRQMELARELRLPIIIHCRDAWEDLREIAAAYWKTSGLGGILHCFSGNAEDARIFLEWGFLISFAGNLTFKKAGNLREVAGVIPLDRLLTETDSPYLAPVPHRGKRNEPAYVRGVTQDLARLRNMSEEALGQQVLGNFEAFLKTSN